MSAPPRPVRFYSSRPVRRWDDVWFLVCYNYGMGGLWGFVQAESSEDILSMYPELEIHTGPSPEWLTGDLLVRVRANNSHRLSDPPAGLLAAVVSDRQSS